MGTIDSRKKITLKFLDKVLVALFAVFAGMLISIWDPFSLSSASKKAMSDFYENILSNRNSYPSEHNVVTLLLTDGDLQGMNAVWPLSHIQQSSVLRAIGLAKPKAVVIDFFFVDDREKIASQKLISELELLACSTSLFVISPPPQSVSTTSVWSEFYSAHQQNSDSRCTIKLVNANRLREGADRFYPVYSDGQLPSPAQAVFQLLDPEQQLHEANSLLDRSSFKIDWSIPTKAECEISSQTAILSANASTTCENTIRGPIFRLVASVLSGFGMDYEEKGVPLLSITAATPTPTFAISELDSRDSAAMHHMRNAIVFYGASVSGLDDNVDTPLYTSAYRHGVPGVFWHASALKTLLNRKNPPERLLSSVLVRLSLTFGTLIACAGVFLVVSGLFERTVTMGVLIFVSSSLAFIGLTIVAPLKGIAPIEWIDIPFLFAAGASCSQPILKFCSARL